MPGVAWGLPRYYTLQGTPNVLQQRTANIFVVTGEALSFPFINISQDAVTLSPNVRTNISTALVMRRLTGKRSENCVVRRFHRCANGIVYLHKP